jgi:hypothetical protein
LARQQTRQRKSRCRIIALSDGAALAASIDIYGGLVAKRSRRAAIPKQTERQGADGGQRQTHVHDGIRRVLVSEKPGIEVVWRTANGMRKLKSPVFKPTLTVRPDVTVVC